MLQDGLATLATLVQLSPGWELVEAKKIRRQFSFKDFAAALGFVNRVGEVAEAEDHHPDAHLFSYKKVEVEFSTRAIGGLSENDFILAAKIDQLQP